MKIALIQTKQNRLYNFIKTDIHFSKEEASLLQQEVINTTLDMINEAASTGADLILTSEAFNYAGPFRQVDADYTSFFSVNSIVEQKLSEIARTNHCYIMAGLIRQETDHKLYNSTVFFDQEGKVKDIYHKINLAGEENDIFTPGKELHVIPTEFGTLAPAICWDMQFPETARLLAQKGCDLILCPTWGWEWIYGPARAYENGIYVASAMTVPYWMPIQELRKPSQVIAPDGNILAEGPYNQASIIYAELPDIHCKERREFRLCTPLSMFSA